MVHVRFDPSDIGYDSYFQTGSGYFEGLPLYKQRGYGNQQGAGLGNLFRQFWRFLKPMAKSLAPVVASAGKAIGEEGLATTARVLNNVVEGGDLKDAISSEGREGVRNLLTRAERKLSRQKGSGKRRRKQSITFKPNDLVGKSVLKKSVPRKRRRVDAFGSY